MKSYQSMWNACAYPMCKHSTSIGNISKSYQLMWNACPNFGKIGQFWKVTNRCGMLAHRVCASIPHRLVTFHEPRNIFNICPHQLVTFENVTYWCVMLAHINYIIPLLRNTYILYFWQEKQPLSFLSEKEKSFFDGKKCRFSEGSPDSLS